MLQDAILTSSVSSEEIDWIIQQLTDLQSFLERNAQFGMTMNPAQDQANNGGQQDAILRERQSLMFLQQLLSHTLQVLGLWMVVCDHQFHTVASKHLNIDELNIIKGMYFRDLIISVIGREICGRLVQVNSITNGFQLGYKYSSGGVLVSCKIYSESMYYLILF